MPNQIAGRPPAEIWGPYLKKALAYREANNNSLRGFPMLTYNNDRWYADPKGNNRYSSKSITVKKDENGQRKNNHISLQEYKDFAQAHGFTEQEAVFHFKQNQRKLKLIRRRSGIKLHFDHLTATSLGGPDHWRNATLSYAPDNISKSNKPLDRQGSLDHGIPVDKDSAMMMDFTGAANPTPRQRRQFVREQGLIPKRPSNTPGFQRTPGSTVSFRAAQPLGPAYEEIGLSDLTDSVGAIARQANADNAMTGINNIGGFPINYID